MTNPTFRTKQRLMATVAIGLAVVFGMRSSAQCLLALLILAAQTRSMPIFADRTDLLGEVHWLVATRTIRHFQSLDGLKRGKQLNSPQISTHIKSERYIKGTNKLKDCEPNVRYSSNTFFRAHQLSLPHEEE
jgi:hypothetical protein